MKQKAERTENTIKRIMAVLKEDDVSYADVQEILRKIDYIFRTSAKLR